MAKFRERNRKYKHHQDVTVNDFANSAVCNTRLKKPTSNVTFEVKKQLEVKDNWDDEVSEGEITTTCILRKKKNSVSKSEDNSGNDYPYDVWFLIGNYIRAEDVGRFACICKTSLEVVLSMQFWIALYKRYYNKRYLPEEFSEVFLKRYCGLRTFVIKALHFMHPPFIAHSRKISTGITHPDILKGKKCIAISLKNEGKLWCYYFKFKLNNSVPFFRNKSTNIVELLNDIHANSEEDHCILKVVSNECIALAPVIGQTLKHVSLNLSVGLCYYRLQLLFSSQVEDYQRKNGFLNGELMIVDRVSKVIIMNWWHPMYLTGSKIPIMNQE